jgi:polysaccharide biosynthesis protein PslH
MKILFVVPYAPSRIRTRPLNFIKGLTSEGHKVSLATLWGDDLEFRSIQGLGDTLDSVIAEKMTAAGSLWNCAKAVVGPRPFQACYSWSDSLAKMIAHSLRTQDFDIIHVEHLRGSEYGLWLKRSRLLQGRRLPPVVWDSVDCISNLFRQASLHSRTLRSRLISRIEYRRTAKYEGWLATQFHRILMTSESDRQGLVALGDQWIKQTKQRVEKPIADRIAVVPNGVDLSYFSPSETGRVPHALVITGKMSYHANVTAVTRFVETVMPRIWAKAPHTQLWIVGKEPSPEIRKLGAPFPSGHDSFSSSGRNGAPRVLITGTVDDLRPYLRRASIAVAPIFYGAGIQNKVLEAMACATPVVASPEAVNALQTRDGRDLVVSRNGQSMADDILSLMNNSEQRRQLGSAGRMFVEINHSWRRIIQTLVPLYENEIRLHWHE